MTSNDHTTDHTGTALAAVVDEATDGASPETLRGVIVEMAGELHSAQARIRYLDSEVERLRDEIGDRNRATLAQTRAAMDQIPEGPRDERTVADRVRGARVFRTVL